jgi:galactose mutarotase-like enzyme
MISITNGVLCAEISETGGELQSLRDAATGREFLWQGDRAYFGRRAMNLFPFVGRLYEGSYLLHGQRYSLPMHGFLPNAPMQAAQAGPDSCCFSLCDSEATRAVFPFAFCFRIFYTLQGRRLCIRFSVENRSPDEIAFGMGGHPAFPVPAEPGLSFADYELTFPFACRPEQIRFDASVLVSGERTPFALRGGRVLPLRHELFLEDAVVLAGTPRRVSLGSPRSAHGIAVDCPQMPYLAFWQRGDIRAPFLCIEPWATLPGRRDTLEDWLSIPGLIHLAAGKTYDCDWGISAW